MSECPTCGKVSKSELGTKVHHESEHNESLAVKETTCDVTGCENQFEYYPSNKEGLICPDCVESGKNIHSTDEYNNLSEELTEYIDTNCHVCNCSLTVTRTDYSERVFCGDECRNLFHSNRMSGENNPRYVDGESSGANYDSKWRTVRQEVLLRDSHKCVLCDSDSNIHVHHIIPVREFENTEDAHYNENAVALCASCHRYIEYGSKSIPDDLIIEKDLEKYTGDHLQGKI